MTLRIDAILVVIAAILVIAEGLKEHDCDAGSGKCASSLSEVHISPATVSMFEALDITGEGSVSSQFLIEFLKRSGLDVNDDPRLKEACFRIIITFSLNLIPFSCLNL